MTVQTHDDSRVRRFLLDRSFRLAEDAEPPAFTERMLQAAWFGRHLPGRMRTADGQTVRVIQPGFWNRSGGPDFRNAVIEIDGRKTVGDVELHLAAEDWFAHGHHQDPAYNGVVLHVAVETRGDACFTATEHRSFVPLLLVRGLLDTDLETLRDELASSTASESSFIAEAGRCAHSLSRIGQDRILEAVREAGLLRFRRKASRWARLTARVGRDQALWEGLCEALGYRENKAPFRHLARTAHLGVLRRLSDPDDRLALLAGLSGLLPAAYPLSMDPLAREHANTLWSRWWKHRAPLRADELTPDHWSLGGTRPQNHPLRRLAAAAHLSRRLPLLVRHLENRNPEELARLEVPPLEDSFWMFRHTFLSRPTPQALSLIGGARWRDIMVNVLLPMAWTWAEDPDRRRRIEEAWRRLPALPPNQIVRTAIQRLRLTARSCAKAHLHQGLHQIYEDFCLEDDSGCAQCPFPGILAAPGPLPHFAGTGLPAAGSNVKDAV